MDSWQWSPCVVGVSCEPAGKIDESRITMSENEQVSQGQELMSLLSVKSAKPCEKADWNVIVKQTFIEVVIPQRGARQRSMSEPASYRFEKAEMLWKSCKLKSSNLPDMSDASTNDSDVEDCDANLCGSIEDNSVREDFCWSSDDEGGAEMMLPAVTEMMLSPELSCQYAEPVDYDQQFWMPMGYDYDPTMCPMGFDQSGMVFDPSAFDPMLWMGAMEECMGAMDYQCSDMAEASSEEWRSTVMIRNMPNNYTREMLLELVDSLGFQGTYDFAYLPVDFQSQAGLGYAFINFSTIDDAHRCFSEFEGFTQWKVPSEKVCTVTWSSPTQGLEAHIDRYRNSPVMHPSLPDEWKPVLLQQGVRVAFPPTTKAIKTPKVRQHPSSKAS